MTICNTVETQSALSLHLTSRGATNRTFDLHRTSHPKPSNRLKWVLLALLMLSLISCASEINQATESEKANEAQSRQQLRERTFQSAWVGKRYDSLLEAFGEPDLHLNILGQRPLKTSLVVYGVLDQSSQCVDAFTMVKLKDTGEWVVADYFCR